MPTDLIDRLATDLQPVRVRSLRRDAAFLAIMAASQLGLFLLLGAARDDLHHAVARPDFWWKLGSLGLLAVLAAVTTVSSFDPAESARRGLRRAGAVAAAALVAGWAVDLGGRDAAPWARLDWRMGVECVVETIVLTLPTLAALGMLMRRGASTDARGSALAAGLAAAAWGAFVFAFACPSDDPFYVAVWYGLSIALVMGLSRLLLPRIARW